MSRPSSPLSSPLSLSQSNYTPSPASLLPRTSLKRRRSLRLLAHPPSVPIPPSLLQSPYLSPQNTSGKRHLSAPTLPSKEDELWLQDTVPMASQPTHSSLERECTKSPGPSPTSPSAEPTPYHLEHPRGRDPSPRSLHHPSPHPPHPLLYHRVPSLVYPPRPQWLTHGQAQSEPDIPRLADHSYFPALASLRR